MTAPPSTRSTRSGGARRWRLVRAHPDAVPYSVRRFMQRARQRRVRAALPWGLVGVLVALGGFGAWLTYGTSVLGVREVRVTGTSILSPAEVVESAGIRDGTPLARVDLSAVETRVSGLVPVDRVTVRRDWPRTVVVDVTERAPVAAVPQGKKFVLVDRAGVAFHTVAARPELPTLKVKSLDAAPAAVQVLGALTSQLRGALVSVTVDGPARIRLALTGGREVIWGDAAQSETKAKVATALLARQDGRTYDVSAPDVVTIR